MSFCTYNGPEKEKNCEFEDITPSKLLASKFASLIGNSTGNYALKQKIRKGNISMEATIDAIHEYLYEEMNNTTDSEDGRTVENVEKRKYKSETKLENGRNKPTNPNNCR